MSEETTDLALVEDITPTMPANLPVVDRSTMAGASLMLNEGAMMALDRIASTMAAGCISVPKHLIGNRGDCLAVAMQAAQWNMNPFVVAQKTHVVNGQLGYEAQLVNAVVQQSGLIEGRFHYEYRGSSPKLECRVGAKIKGEKEITWGEWHAEDKVQVKNSPLWKTNPRQQMGYLQVKNWARLYTPGAILGVYTPDEFEKPQPRSMGNAHVIRPEASPELVKAADDAAKAGVTTYAEFWQGITKEQRQALGDGHDARKETAKGADIARTIDNGTEGEPARTEPMFNGHKVGQFLNEAKDEDELNAAADLINHLTNPDDIKSLSELYDERLAAFRNPKE